MGSRNPRYRRPFVWQDEMVEVRNLFKRVAKVKQSGFTGFSIWKDEPTAETLSRNRLRKRRCQYAVEVTHLNYAESPFDAQNHLNNIRGMCSRIQRQDRFVERKKKDYDLDLHPALLRRPVTVSYPWSKDGSDRLLFRSSRPRTAPGGPHLDETPLHYTPSKPTMLYDATHKCPRHRDVKQSSMLSQKSSRSSATPSLKVMANPYNYDWDLTPKGSSPPGMLSPSVPSSVSSLIYYAGSPAMNSPTSCKQNDQSSHMRPHLEDQRRTAKVTSKDHADSTYGGYLSDVERTSRTDTSSKASTLNPSDLETTGAPTFSSSRPSSMERRLERPPSRMMSKRPTTTLEGNAKSVQERSHKMNNDDCFTHNVNFDSTFKESTSGINSSYNHNGGSFSSKIYSSSPSNIYSASSSNIYSSSPSNIYSSAWPGKSRETTDLFANQPSKPPKQVSNNPTMPQHWGRALQEQTSSSARPREALQAVVAKHKQNSLPGDGSGGLWALKQEQQRPFSANASILQTTTHDLDRKENGNRIHHPSTSSVRSPSCELLSKEEECIKLGSDPLVNRMFTKKDEQEVKALQREFDQELHKITRLDYERGKSGMMLNSLNIKQESSTHHEAPPPVPQLHDQPGEGFLARGPAAPASNINSSDQPSSSGSKQPGPDMTGGEDNHESHVMIKHSTDPYMDFKNSMLRMIHEENLYDKHWEMEELFQYYIDLNPVVHHEVLKKVISDIRTDIAAQRAKSF